jgi:hypothetical protein
LKRIILPLCVAALFSAPTPSRSEELLVEFDPAITKINWIWNVHTTHGTFQLKQAHVVKTANGNISGELPVEAATGESGNSGRDKRMYA